MIKNSTLILMAFLLIIGNAFAEESNPPPACPTIQMSGASVACYGQSNGRARVTILSGGSGNYTYTWSQGTVASGSGFHEITNLIAGTYTVTVRDNVSGCTVVGAYVVGTPNPITISGTVTNVNCFGGSTGSISTIVNGGNNPYTFTWKNSSGVTISTGGAGFNNLNSVNSLQLFPPRLIHLFDLVCQQCTLVWVFISVYDHLHKFDCISERCWQIFSLFRRRFSKQ